MEPERRRRYLIDVPGGEEEEPSIREPPQKPPKKPPKKPPSPSVDSFKELVDLATSLNIENTRDFYNHLLVDSGVTPRTALALSETEDIASVMRWIIIYLRDLPAHRIAEQKHFIYVNYMVDEDEPLGGLEWDDIAKIELEQQLEVTTERSSYDYYERLGAIHLRSTSGEANNGESEWIVFKDEDAAEEAAVDRVRDDLEENPEIFTQSWLENFINQNNFKHFVREDVESYAYDAIGERELIEWGYLDEPELDDEGDEIEHTESEIDAARERYIDRDVEEKVRAGPIAFFREIYGRDEAAKQAIDALGIDINEAAQDAVDTDGIAHFLDVYDGDAVELPSGAYAYGTN